MRQNYNVIIGDAIATITGDLPDMTLDPNAIDILAVDAAVETTTLDQDVSNHHKCFCMKVMLINSKKYDDEL